MEGWRLRPDKRPVLRWVSGLVLGIFLLLTTFLFMRQMQGSTTSRDIIPLLRLSPQQVLLNWQSFPGRMAVIEYCSIRALPDGSLRCVLIDGSREAGYVELDKKTIEPASGRWAAETCS